jgi:hypothetical protein
MAYAEDSVPGEAKTMHPVESKLSKRPTCFCQLALALAGALACSQASIQPSGASGGAAGMGGGAAGAGSGGGADAPTVIVLPDAARADACVPAAASTACSMPGGSYCGVIGNGCGGTIDCGNSCPAGWSCDVPFN